MLLEARAHLLSGQQVLEAFHVDDKYGLSPKAVDDQLARHGRNILPEDPPTSLVQLVLEQFKDQLVIILLVSAAISFVLALLEEGEDKATAFVEPTVILLILVANAIVGVVQETNAEKAIEALMQYSPDEAKVIRSGKVDKIHASDLVPGDIIQIAVGDRVPADCRLLCINSASFTVDQALLTGESVSVGKSVAPVDDEHAVKQDMINMLFSGTTVVTGNARAIVTATGTRTAIGDIHTSIVSQISEKTPLKQKLDDFGDMLAKVITVICVLVWLINIRNFSDPAHGGLVKGAVYYFKIAVALAVAAIPEGLAVIITTCLALGTKKMAKKNAIVRSLPSVETLGCTNVICADKTGIYLGFSSTISFIKDLAGTLTTNQMSVARFVVASPTGLLDYEVEGTTYAPSGQVFLKGSPEESPSASSAAVRSLAEICAVCNDSKIAYNADHGTYAAIGEPTEAALKILAEKLKTGDAATDLQLNGFAPAQRVNAVNAAFEARITRLLTFEFSRDRKSMSVLVRDESVGIASLLVKGAPESVIERCTNVQIGDRASEMLSGDMVRNLQQRVDEYAVDGLRVLALARVDNIDPDASHYRSASATEYARFEQKMTLVGLVGMRDPPRPEAKKAIAKCREAGIRVVVITGDNRNTAITICRQLGIFGRHEDVTGKSYTGKEFDALSQREKIDAVMRAHLFSRTEPGHKRQLVDLLQEQGLVVAMTGGMRASFLIRCEVEWYSDGVNDAPALKRASIGIAMGSGTDVAKLAADMVLADNNFASIEQAIEEGRSIFENTKAFIRYLISSNIGEVVSIFLTVLLGMPEALIPVQLLWVNLVTDGLPATALGFNPPDHHIMSQPPRNAREPLVSGWLFFRYLVIGAYVGCATVGGYAWWFMYYTGGPQITFFQLTHFHSCPQAFPEIGCQMFTDIRSRSATTISLSILVLIEMFNAMNSLSETESLLVQPLWKNLYLVAAIVLSMMLHFMILYVPFFSNLFVITPLNWEEWRAVLFISLPVIFIDECLKFVSVTLVAPPKVKTD